MTPIGHSLAGLSFAVLGAPLGMSRARKAAFAAAFVVLPNLPDLPVRGWGHDDYVVSHSLIVNLVLAAVCVRILVSVPVAWRACGGLRGVLCGVLAWQSHFLLDSFYNHGKGVAIYWPVSKARLDLAMPWFRTLPGWALDWTTARIVIIEAAFYGTVLALALGARALEIRTQRALKSAIEPEPRHRHLAHARQAEAKDERVRAVVREHDSVDDRDEP